jgi:cell division protein FtsQ
MKKTVYTLFLVPLCILSTLTVIYVCSSGQRFFLLKDVKIKGIEQLTDRDVIGKACPFLKDSIFSIDVEQLKTAVAQHPFVREVRVKRVFPFSLVIDVQEKKPSALWVPENGQIQVLDEDGFPFRALMRENIKGLYVINAPDKQEARKAFGMIREWAGEGIIDRDGISEIVYNKGNMTLVGTDEAVEIILGKEDQKERLKRAAAVLEDAKKRGLLIRCIDARFEKGAIVKERTG